MTEEAIARLTLRGAGEWSKEGRKAIADWLRAQADGLENEGHNYSVKFTARYIVPSEEANG